jgi:hypothetical protein
LVTVASIAGTARATTGVGVVINVPVTVRASVVTVKKNEYSTKMVARYPRGTTVHFHVRNTTSHIIWPQLRVKTGLNFVGGNKVSKITRAPHAIGPGKTASFNVFFFFRGTFAFEAVTASKVVATAPVAVI